MYLLKSGNQIRNWKSWLIIAFFSIALSSYTLAQDNRWVAPEVANNVQNPLSENLKATEKGRKIYKKLCWSCHGMNGNGDGPAAASLSPAPSDYSKETVQHQTDGAIYWKITTGRGQMVSYERTLSADQRWMLVNYIRTLAVEGTSSASASGE